MKPKSLKATFKRVEGWWQLIFSDPDYEVYSYKDGDCIYGFSWRDFDALPEQLKALAMEVFEGEEVEVEVPANDLVHEGLSIVKRGTLEPVLAIGLEEAEQFYNEEGVPIEEDHPESPLRKLGLI